MSDELSDDVVRRLRGAASWLDVGPIPEAARRRAARLFHGGSARSMSAECVHDSRLAGSSGGFRASQAATSPAATAVYALPNGHVVVDALEEPSGLYVLDIELLASKAEAHRRVSMTLAGRDDVIETDHRGHATFTAVRPGVQVLLLLIDGLQIRVLIDLLDEGGLPS